MTYFITVKIPPSQAIKRLLLIRIHSLLLLPALIFIALLSGCGHNPRPNRQGKVYIDQQNGRFTIVRNGKPFAMRGAGGYSHLRELAEAGGNTLRTWDTTHIGRILDSAQANHIAVIVGLPLPNSGDISFYNDQRIVTARYNALRSLVNRFKSHPAVLMWCLGNELDFPNKWAYRNFYSGFNALTDMIRREDPDHPITTTILNFNRKYIFNIRLRCHVDLLSFNIFSNLPLLRRDLADIEWFWKGPFMLLEWGINGPWQGTEQTAWGAYIEDTSKKKADIYRQRYQTDMPTENPRLLGACVFFWGNKQETTHTWFSIFDEDGNRSEAINTMQAIWTGKPAPRHYPEIRYMLVNAKGARDNIILTPGDSAAAEVSMFESEGHVRSIRWQVFREDWYRRNQANSTRKLVPLSTTVHSGDDLKLTFPAPAQEGPYRVFATIYDGEGNFASCNTPFYVVNKP